MQSKSGTAQQQPRQLSDPPQATSRQAWTSKPHGAIKPRQASQTSEERQRQAIRTKASHKPQGQATTASATDRPLTHGEQRQPITTASLQESRKQAKRGQPNGKPSGDEERAKQTKRTNNTDSKPSQARKATRTSRKDKNEQHTHRQPERATRSEGKPQTLITDKNPLTLTNNGTSKKLCNTIIFTKPLILLKPLQKMKNTNQGAQDKTEREATATIKRNRQMF